MFCGLLEIILVQNHNRYTTARDIIFRGAGETNGGYALLMMAKPPKAALYRAHTFFFSLHHMLACSSFLSSFFTHKFEVCSHV